MRAGETRTVGAYEAKTTLSALLDFVEQGNDVVITKHDRPVARLVPVGAPLARGEVFARLRGLRGRLKLAPGETPKDLITAGRRI
ncbi:MAG TPA: type II toxin-antitoxin system prevent-host-death family antitoxin [Vicinamibacterales bacterium]|nr:type II toxin-antitoxin system prevent-host-death family antitoxin [Vicinamibacterales bacterium]